MRDIVSCSFSALLIAVAIAGSARARPSGARALIENTCHTVGSVTGEYFEYYGADGRYVAYHASPPRHTEYDSWMINETGDLCLRFAGGDWCYIVKIEGRNVIMTNRRTGLAKRCQFMKGNPLQMSAASRLSPFNSRHNSFQIASPA